MIDERTRAALARLTHNERACLVRRLNHQTAKEMAIDLGVSPHAVEKRLKMARTKLGVSSSLEAAQLLAASEEYGQTGPQPSDLGSDAPAPQDRADPALPAPAWRRVPPYALTGAAVMSLALAAILAVAPLSAPSPVPARPAPQALPSYLVQLTLKQGGRVIGSPKLLVVAGQSARAAATSADGARYDIALSVTENQGSTYFVKMDLNSSSANGRGVHVTPAALVKAGETVNLTVGPSDEPVSLALTVTSAPRQEATSSGTVDVQPGTTSIVKTVAEWEAENHMTRMPLVKAPPEVVRSYVNGTFDALDKNRSGFIERREAPPGGIAFETIIPKGPPLKWNERPLYPDPKTKIAVISGTSGQAAWIALYDKDEDGKVSRDEYVSVNYERDLVRGIPSGWQDIPPLPPMIKASAETVRTFLNESFDIWDKDHSGFIERPEVRASSGLNRASGKSDAPFETDLDAQAAWIVGYDIDKDGKVSRAEYVDGNFERLMNIGVPANWHGAPKVAAK